MNVVVPDWGSLKRVRDFNEIKPYMVVALKIPSLVFWKDFYCRVHRVDPSGLIWGYWKSDPNAEIDENDRLTHMYFSGYEGTEWYFYQKPIRKPVGFGAFVRGHGL